MVIEEIGFPKGSSPKVAGPKLVAPVQDRLIATFFDAFLVLPFCSLLAVPSLQALKVEEALGTTALRLFMVYANLAFIYVFGSALLLAVMAHRYGGTPGQRLMRMRFELVHPRQDNEEPSFITLFFRFVLWWLAILPLGLPFFEILANPRRVAFYDKICDLRIVTEKKCTDQPPSPAESFFLYRWLMTMSMVFIVTFGTFYFKIQNSFLSEVLPTEPVAFASCRNQLGLTGLDSNYIDLMITRQMVNEESKTCLDEIGDHALWTDPSKSFQGWGYLAKGWASGDEIQREKYLLESCKVGPKEEPCLISQFLLSAGGGRGDLLRKTGLTTGLARFLLAKESIAKDQFDSANALIRDLRREPELATIADRLQVRMVWRAREGQARGPAGQHQWSDLFSDFEKRFLAE